jgi:hypothetical protein
MLELGFVGVGGCSRIGCGSATIVVVVGASVVGGIVVVVGATVVVGAAVVVVVVGATVVGGSVSAVASCWGVVQLVVNPKMKHTKIAVAVRIVLPFVGFFRPRVTANW